MTRGALVANPEPFLSEGWLVLLQAPARSFRWWMTSDPAFDRIIPYIRIQAATGGGRKTPRVELPSPPWMVELEARQLQRPCVSCGRPTKIVRERTMGFMGGAVRGGRGGLYISLLCDSASCQHGLGRLAYADFVEHIVRSQPQQKGLALGGATP